MCALLHVEVYISVTRPGLFESGYINHTSVFTFFADAALRSSHQLLSDASIRGVGVKQIHNAPRLLRRAP